jgi:hypothetical protein
MPYFVMAGFIWPEPITRVASEVAVQPFASVTATV